MNSSSLEVSYPDLAETQSLLAIWLTDVPKDMLLIFDQVLKGIVYSQFPHYKQVPIAFIFSISFMMIVSFELGY